MSGMFRLLFRTAFVAALVLGTSELSAQPDPMEALAPFIGTWSGSSNGTPGDGTVTRTCERILRGRYVRVISSTVYPPQPRNKAGEHHEDVGYISFDRARKRFVLRQFHVEGFVNQYLADTPGPIDGRWVFTSEAIENIASGWRARETYVFHSAGDIEEIFELAAPGKDFDVYSRTRLKRK